MPRYLQVYRGSLSASMTGPISHDWDTLWEFDISVDNGPIYRWFIDLRMTTSDLPDSYAQLPKGTHSWATWFPKMNKAQGFGSVWLGWINSNRESSHFKWPTFRASPIIRLILLVNSSNFGLCFVLFQQFPTTKRNIFFTTQNQLEPC